MTEDNSKQEGQEVSVWPGRYLVYAKVWKFPHRGYFYEDVSLKFFRHDMSDEEAKALLEPLGFTSDMEDYLYIKSQAEETFTEEQANQLIAFMETYSYTKAWKEPAQKPSENSIGVGGLAVGGGDDFYMLSEEKKYDLPFKAWAYFNVRDCEYIGKTALGGLKEQIDINLPNLTEEEIQELKEYLDHKIKSGKGGGYYDRG